MSSSMEARILLSKVTNDDQSEVCLRSGRGGLTFVRFGGSDWDFDLLGGHSFSRLSCLTSRQSHLWVGKWVLPFGFVEES
jgi:hypothetical protein